MGRLVIRRIRASDGPLLRDLRLRSLTDSPEAFGQTIDEAIARPDADWDAQARAASDGDRRAWFIAEMDGAPVGLVQARRRPPEEVLVFSMWVEPAHRRASVGRRLIEAVERWARGWGSRRTVLWVIAGNEAAIRFYDRLGFRTELEGPDADSGRAYGALAMSLTTGSGPGAADRDSAAESSGRSSARSGSAGSLARSGPAGSLARSGPDDPTARTRAPSADPVPETSGATSTGAAGSANDGADGTGADAG